MDVLGLDPVDIELRPFRPGFTSPALPFMMHGDLLIRQQLLELRLGAKMIVVLVVVVIRTRRRRG